MSEAAAAVVRSELNIVKEFCEDKREAAQYAGRLVIRSRNYGDTLGYFDQLFAAMEEVASNCEPPLGLDRDDVEVVHYGGRFYKNTYGLETYIPLGIKVPDDCIRIIGLEDRK